MDELTMFNATKTRHCSFVEILDDAVCEEIPEQFTLIAQVYYGGILINYLTEIVITESFDDPDCGKCV